MTRRGDPRTPGVGLVRGASWRGQHLEGGAGVCWSVVLPTTTSESPLSHCSPGLPLPVAESHHPVLWGPPEKGQTCPKETAGTWRGQGETDFSYRGMEGRDQEMGAWGRRGEETRWGKGWLESCVLQQAR